MTSCALDALHSWKQDSQALEDSYLTQLDIIIFQPLGNGKLCACPQPASYIKGKSIIQL